MKILVDENIPFANETFGQHGELIRYPGRQLQASDLINVDALITRSITKVNAELFTEGCPDFVGTCTIGTDHLDIPFLESSNIGWAYAPGCNAQSVVDYVLSVFAALKGHPLPNAIGIVGCGNVGGLLRERMLTMGLSVQIYDPFLDVEDIPELTSLDQVFHSDIVCLHTPYTESGEFPTKAMIGAEQLTLLPENALLISAGRGGVICEAELQAFMRERPDVQVALDVWQGEPCVNPELLQSVAIATPHIAGYSMEGKRRGTLQVYQAFCECFELEPQESLADLPALDINLSSASSADYLLAIYDPRLDMYRMRNSFALADEGTRSTGSWFDELRRSYPERREIGSFRLAKSGLPASLKTELEKIGFRNFI